MKNYPTQRLGAGAVADNMPVKSPAVLHAIEKILKELANLDEVIDTLGSRLESVMEVQETPNCKPTDQPCPGQISERLNLIHDAISRASSRLIDYRNRLQI